MGGLVIVKSRKKITWRKAFSNEDKAAISTTPAAPQLAIYPNPVSAGSLLNIQCHSLETGSYRAELYTLAGQQAQVQRIHYASQDKQISLRIGKLVPGMYSLLLVNEKTGEQLTQRVVIGD